jgi:hypothetical protein
LSDKTPDRKFKGNSTAQDMLAASTMKVSWLSQTDRELNYAEMISGKIRSRRLCLKVFRAFRLSIRNKIQRFEQFDKQRLRAYFNSFKKGVTK